jgi:hypothetical protein
MNAMQYSKVIVQWIFFLFIALGAQQGLAQGASYNEAGGEVSLGPRFGGSSGLSFKKHAFNNESAFEILAGWNFDENVDGVNLNLLWEKLAPISGQRFCALFGGGPSFAFGDEFRFGVAGIIGFDWRITNVVNLQVDWQPTWYFVNGSDFSPINAGFTIRYVLNHVKTPSNQ